jgi:hypothetical protein
MITKKRLKEQIDQLPEEFSLDELVDRLIVIEKIEKDISQSEKGETISHGKMEEEIQKWFK